MNKIEIKETQSQDNNVEVIDVFVNDEFYTAIVGIRFGNKINYHKKYKFIHDALNLMIATEQDYHTLFNTLTIELLELENHELTSLLFLQ